MLFGFAWTSKSQGLNLSEATKGKIYIEAAVDGRPAVLTSDDLIIFLDIENATFKYLLDPSTLSGINHHYQKQLAKMSKSIVIEGALDINRIPQNDHSPIQTNVEARTNSSDFNEIIPGKAKLRYTHSQRFDSLMEIRLSLEPGDLGLSKYLTFTSDLVVVKINHQVIHGSI